MRIVANIALALTVLACILVLVFSIYPGLLNDLVLAGIALLFFVVPPVGIGSLAVLMYLARSGMLADVRIPWIQAVTATVVIVGTVFLVRRDVPQRIAFRASREAFDGLLADAPSSKEGVVLDRRLGAYYVDEYAADPRGGTYFRVYTGTDRTGTVSMSYGFAHSPNPKGSPFGAAKYRTYHVADDWWWFRASEWTPEWHDP